MSKINMKAEKEAYNEKSMMSKVMFSAREKVFKSRVGSINV